MEDDPHRQRLHGRHGDPIDRVSARVGRLLEGLVRPRVLEAGCGSTSRLPLPPDRILVGLDISPRQLARHTSLDEPILGDLQEHRWPADSFDLIVCWDVIEHLSQPAQALRHLFAALRPGGGVVLAFPNFWSLKGFVTKLTPFRLHAWFYRLLGDPRPFDAMDQFPTPFRLDIAVPRMRRLAVQSGLEVMYEELYEGPVQVHLRQRSRLADAAFGTLGLLSRACSLGRIDLGLSDGVLILRRPPSDQAPGAGRT